MYKRLAILTAIGMLLMLVACEGINCTLNNVVLLHVGFYDSSTGQPVALTDTLTVTAEGTDSVLLNRKVGAQGLTLPMSYWREADSLLLTISGPDYQWTEVVYLHKENTPHYESPDCPATMFHLLKQAEWNVVRSAIDSVVIVKPTVNYQTDENVRIYFSTGN